MKDENIKEILDYLKALSNNKFIMLDLSREDYKSLYNYITNLQEELEHYKQLGLNQKQFEYENKIKILEHNCKQAEDSCRQHRLANKNKKRRLQRREEQINLYKTRIDKAINYLKTTERITNNPLNTEDNFDRLWINGHEDKIENIDNLINILQGSDKE